MYRLLGLGPGSYTTSRASKKHALRKHGKLANCTVPSLVDLPDSRTHYIYTEPCFYSLCPCGVWKELQIGRWGRSGRWRRGCRRGSGSTRGTTSSCSTTSSTGSPAAAMTAVASPCPTSTSTSASHGTFQVCLSLNTSFFLYILDLKSIIPPKKTEQGQRLHFSVRELIEQELEKKKRN
jgi:hypothetical protein